MNAAKDTFLITPDSRLGGGGPQLWTAEAPLILGPRHPWLLEKTPEGIRVRDISGLGGRINRSSCYLMPLGELSSSQGATLRVNQGGREETLRINRVRPIPTPYLR